MQPFSVIQKAYLTQYISLMLIVLSCLIAASGSRHVVADLDTRIPIEPVSAGSSNQYLKSALVFENIFDPQSGSINAHQLEPLKEILEAHDLDLKLEIFASHSVGTKVAHLSKVLREQGFWKDSFVVSGSTQIAESQNAELDAASGARLVAYFQRSRQ